MYLPTHIFMRPTNSGDLKAIQAIMKSQLATKKSAWRSPTEELPRMLTFGRVNARIPTVIRDGS